MEESSPKDSGWVRYPGRAIGVFTLAVLLGPPIGSLLVLGPIFVAAMRSLPSLADLASAVASIAAMGYVFGAARAGLAGLWIGYRVWASGHISYLGCVLAALAATLLGTVYLLVVTGWDSWSAELILNGLLGVAAIVAALACRWIAGMLGILPR